MFGILLVLVISFAVLLILAVWYAQKHPARYGWSGAGLCAFWLSLVPLIFFFIMFIAGGISSTCDQQSNLTEIEGLKQNTKVLNVQRTRVENDIRAQLDKYPEIEKSIIKDISPQILLQYPQLKSNETITKAFESLNAMNEKMSNNEQAIANVKAKIRMREFSALTVKVPGLFITYQEYYNEPLNQGEK